MKTFATVAVLVVSGCSHRVYSPPSQAFGLGPVTAMSEGAQTLDVELASHSQIFDPALHSGAARLTRGIGQRTEVTGEGTAYSVSGRQIYAGRAGVRHSPGEDLALFAGAGGGFAPIAGGFTTLDAGMAIGIHNCVLVPVLQGSAFVSQPIAARAVDVSAGDAMETDTPATTFGATVRGGLRLSLAPSECRRGEPGTWLYAGFDMTGVKDHDSEDSLFGVGIGLSVPL